MIRFFFCPRNFTHRFNEDRYDPVNKESSKDCKDEPDLTGDKRFGRAKCEREVKGHRDVDELSACVLSKTSLFSETNYEILTTKNLIISVFIALQ